MPVCTGMTNTRDTDNEEPPCPSTPRTRRPRVESPYAVLRWLVLATFVVILNETIMVNAIPRLMVELDVSARSAQWLSTAFMLTMAVVIPVTGWFLQRVTTRQAFVTAMTVFLAGTLLSALAPVFWVLVAGRVVQAAGTAVMLPLLMTTLMTIVPQHDRGRVMGNVMLAISVAPALGPAVSGVVLQFASWRWLFGLVLPIAAAITWVSLRRLVNVGETREGRLDVPSVVLAALGFGTLVYGLSRIGAEARRRAPRAGAGRRRARRGRAFLLRQRGLQKRDMPLLDLRVLSHRTYAVGVTIQSVSFLAMMGAMILLPLYLQDLRGLSPLRPACWSRPAASPWACSARGSGAPSTGSAPARW